MLCVLFMYFSSPLSSLFLCPEMDRRNSIIQRIYLKRKNKIFFLRRFLPIKHFFCSLHKFCLTIMKMKEMMAQLLNSSKEMKKKKKKQTKQTHTKKNFAIFFTCKLKNV